MPTPCVGVPRQTAGRTTVTRATKALRAVALPVGELREQRLGGLGRHVALSQRAGEANRLAELLDVLRAVGAGRDVRLEARAVAARERAVEVVGHELDELPTDELPLSPQRDHRWSPR